jgi:hypothetical protein
MLTVYASLLPVFILIAVGFGLRKSAIIPEEHWRGVELISYWILIPALLVTVLSNSVLGFEQATNFALTLLLTVLLISLLMWGARRPLKRWLGVEGPAFTSLFQTTTRWHGYISLAIAGRLFGDPGLALLAIAFAVMVPFINVVNILVLATYAANEPAPGRLIVKTLLRNPLIWAIVIGLTIRFSGLTLPDVAATTLNLAGDGALGVSLLALGAGLSWRAVRRTGKEVVLAILVKIVLTPLVAIGIALMFGLTGMDFVVVVLATAVPTAVNGYVLARTMGGDAELYAASVTAQVILSFVTLPLFVWWALQVTA